MSEGIDGVRPFSERVRLRYARWWGAPPRSAAGLRERFHRHVEHFSWRDARDPDEAWRCCRFWQRTLANKWNSRQFAGKHGARVPRLYRHGRRTSRLLPDDLPDRYVIRPVYGHSSRDTRVIVDGLDLLSGESGTRAAWRRRLREDWGRFSRVVLLVEEFLGPTEGAAELPRELKFHMFRDRVGLVELNRRFSRKETERQYYTMPWNPFGHALVRNIPESPLTDPPRGFEELLPLVARMGRAYDTYVRMDFLESPSGLVFGEFAPTPRRGQDFTAVGDAFLGRLWQDTLGDSI